MAEGVGPRGEEGEVGAQSPVSAKLGHQGGARLGLASSQTSRSTWRREKTEERKGGNREIKESESEEGGAAVGKGGIPGFHVPEPARCQRGNCRTSPYYAGRKIKERRAKGSGLRCRDHASPPGRARNERRGTQSHPLHSHAARARRRPHDHHVIRVALGPPSQLEGGARALPRG